MIAPAIEKIEDKIAEETTPLRLRVLKSNVPVKVTEPQYRTQTSAYLMHDSASRYKDDRPNGTFTVRFQLDIKQDAEQIRQGLVNLTGCFITMTFPTKSAFDAFYTQEKKQTHRLDYLGAEQFIGFDPRKFYL